jgi:hypothetical protein
MAGTLEFYFWPGDEFNAPEFAYGANGTDRFTVKPLANVFRKSPRLRRELDDPAGGWVKLQPVSAVVAQATAQLYSDSDSKE